MQSYFVSITLKQFYSFDFNPNILTLASLRAHAKNFFPQGINYYELIYLHIFRRELISAYVIRCMSYIIAIMKFFCKISVDTELKLEQTIES